MASGEAWNWGAQIGRDALAKGDKKKSRQEELQDEQRQQTLRVYDDLHNQGRISAAELKHSIEDIYHDAEPEKKMFILGRLLNRKKAQQQHNDFLQGKQKLATELQGIVSGAKQPGQSEADADTVKKKAAIQALPTLFPDATPEQLDTLKMHILGGSGATPKPTLKEYTSPDGKQRQWFTVGEQPEGWQAQQGAGSQESEYQKATVAARVAKQALDQAKFDASQDPKNPVTKAKLQSAQANKEKADAYMLRAQAGVYGSVGGQPLPGAMVDEEGKPIGAMFQSNVRPTGSQREKATLATSALEQLSDMETILKKRGDLFGPGAGRAQQLAQWVGSPDPDAQRFTSAVTTAADHLMGVFGGRSTYAGERIEKAIGQLKTDPEAALAAIQQMGKAAKLIQGVGSYKTVGGGEASPTGGKKEPAPKAQGGGKPKDGDTKKNAAGDTIVFHGGKWGIKSAAAATN